MVGGLGKQGSEYINVLKSLDYLAEVSVIVDPRKQYDNIKPRGNVKLLSDIHYLLPNEFDVGFITVPHSAHYDITRKILAMGKNVIKEKPFACTLSEANKLFGEATKAKRSILTTTKRSHSKAFLYLSESLLTAGKIHSFEYKYVKAFPAPTTGWRSVFNQSRGGVLLDMGYHIFDLIIRLFGCPLRVCAIFGYYFNESLDEKLEDTVFIQMDYGEFIGFIQIARHDFTAVEQFRVVAETKSVTVTSQEVIENERGGISHSTQISQSDEMVNSTMIKKFIKKIDNNTFSRLELENSLKSIKLIDAIRKSVKNNTWVYLDPNNKKRGSK